MKPRIAPNAQIARHNTLFGYTTAGLMVRASSCLILAILLAGVFYAGSSASSQKGASTASQGNLAKVNSSEGNSEKALAPPSILRLPVARTLAPEPAPSLPGIATFASDGTNCTSAQADFNLGDWVCAKATGVPVTIFSWHVSWVDPIGFIVQSDTAIADDQATYLYHIPLSATSVVNGETVSNVGTFRVNLTRFSGAILQTARFTVHEPLNPTADVFVQKFASGGDNSVPSGGSIPFTIVVGNNGPDAAVNVHLVDSAPSDFTVSFTQQSGPACLPLLTSDCTIASMANGDRAEFTAVYNSGGNAQGTYPTSATVSSATPDPDNSNNTTTSDVVITAATGAGTCVITCPADVTADANTTELGQRGAHVTFDDAVGTGDCGSVSTAPISGSFFPVGTTIVHATSETGGGACTFTVTVDDPSGNTTITCPSNKTATADANCGATVSLGTPTATGDNVTIIVSRSDGLPMYDCSVPGPNCVQDVRKTTDLPFPAGVTTVTWTAFSHDTPGPYANEDDEIAHRTGNAQCQQTVTVNDVTPPTITAANQTASANANCQAAVPDFTTIATVSDNCACASSDTSQICDSRQDISITQSPAPGTLVGLGPHNITLTANDGSSNPNPGPDGILGTGDDGTGNIRTIVVTFTVNDTTPPAITCPANIANVPTEPGICAAHVNPGTATATDNCDSNPTITAVRSDNQPLTATYPRGTTTITWTATDAAGNHSSCDQTITVVDKEPPVIVLNGQTPSMWPPNHKYHTFGVTNFVTAVTDNCDTINVSAVVIVKVTSDEVENGNGDGNTLKDIVIAPDCMSVQLRSEREGNSNGRVYRIFFSVTDASGNVGTASSTVVVQHNPGETAVEGLPQYTVYCGGL